MQQTNMLYKEELPDAVNVQKFKVDIMCVYERIFLETSFLP